jgi:exonuclease V
VRALEAKLETRALAALPATDSLLDLDAVPPITRFRSFPRKPLTVTDMTAGAWCELQYYYTLTRLPGGRKARTAQMTAGSRVHKQLEDQVHETVRVEVATREDAMGVRLWNMVHGLRMLAETGLAREVQVWGTVQGHLVSGVIDGLSWEDPEGGEAAGGAGEEEAMAAEAVVGGEEPAVERPRRRRGRPSKKQKEAEAEWERARLAARQGTLDTYVLAAKKAPRRVVYLTDVKTRGSMTIPPPSAIIPARVQLNLYRQFINDMLADKLSFLKVVRRYGADPDEPFTDAFLAQMAGLDEDALKTDGRGSSGEEREEEVAVKGESPVKEASPVGDVSEAAPVKHESPAASPSTPQNDDASDSDSSSSYVPPPSPQQPSVLRYRTLRAIIPLIKESLAAAFPQGAASVSPRLCVEYRHRGDGEIVKRVVFDADARELGDYVANDMAWWTGERAPHGVSLEDTFKCRSCDFADECEWRQRLDLERLHAARERLALRREREEAVRGGALP